MVDYKGFTQTHYDAPDFLIYERGIRWVVRGVLHLLLYRLVYHQMSLDPLDVQTLGELVKFMTGTFLMYLRVSGQFHLIIGVLHLFGFHLTETHRLYYLASSFTDLWRRINLYWTDFMMKLVYYPSFFRLRRFGQRPALLLSTAIVFVVTWALHGWQAFWLLGDPNFTLPDALFWGILAMLVLVTTLYEKGKPRAPVVRAWRLGRAVAVTGTFLGMSVLWSLWSSDSVADWLGLFYAARETTRAELYGLGVLLVVGMGIAGFPWGIAPLAAGSPSAPSLGVQLRDGGLRVALLAGAFALSSVWARPLLPDPVRVLAQQLGQNRLNARDEARLQRGYYDQLNAADRTGGQLWDMIGRRPKEWDRGLFNTDRVTPVDGVLLAQLAPNLSTTYNGQPFSTNAWGMRDRAYEKERAPGTYRIAVLGPSLVMGYGVADGVSFEAQLEERLAARVGPGRIELLNFGFEGHSLSQQLAAFERQAKAFAPDLVLITITPLEHRMAAEHLQRILGRRATVEYPYLSEALRQTGLAAGDKHPKVVRRLRPYASGLARSALGSLNQRISDSGARAAAILLRMPTQPMGQLEAYGQLAAAVGLTTLDLSDAYAGTDEDALRGHPWDRHPNAEGNRLLALALERELDRALLLPDLPPVPPFGD